MSTTVLEKDVVLPVTVEITDCEGGGYAWIVKEYSLVGQADTMEDLRDMVNDGVSAMYKFAASQLDITRNLR